MPQVAILSPHPDDAVLSLWHLLTGPSEAAVLTVFNGPREERRQPGWWDRLTGARDGTQRARERAHEDREALAVAGRAPQELGFVDGQYRDGPQPVEPLATGIDAAAPDGAVLLAPAALDAHRDHVVVRDAALALGQRGRRVELYADVPHATLYGWPAWVTGAPRLPYLDPEAFWEVATGDALPVRELPRSVCVLDAGQDAAKRRALASYRTQLPALDAMFSVISRPDVLRHEVVWTAPRA